MKRLVPMSFFAVFVAVLMLGSFPAADALAQKDPKDKKSEKKDEAKKDVAKKDDAKKDAKTGDTKKDEKKEPEPEKKEPPFIPDAPAFELKGHENWIRGLAYSKDGSLLVSAGRDRTVRVWEVASKKEKGNVKGFNDDIALAVAGDHLFVSAGKWNKEKKVYEGEIVILELPTGKKIGSIKANPEIIDCVGVTPDGKTIVTGSDDMTAKVFDASGKELQTLKGHTDKILGVALSPDGKRAATAGYDGTLRIWDVATGKDSATLKNEIVESKADPKSKKETKTTRPGAPLRCVAFSPDGKKVAAGGEDSQIRLVDAESGNVEKTIKAPDGVLALTFNAAGDKLASGGWDKSIRIWDLSGKELNAIKAHTGSVTALAFDPTGKWIASGGLDGLVKVWPVEKK